MNGKPSTTGVTHPDSVTPTDSEVIVVGAGPTGLLLAGDLAAAGVTVTVLEKRAAGISNLTRAFGVHARTLEQLDARGLADELTKTGRHITELRLFARLTLTLDSLPSRFPFLLITPQYEVERALHRRATEHGATFVHNAEVTAVRQDSTGVDVEVRQVEVRQENDTEKTDREKTHRERTYRASYVVGADGVRSAVREQIGQSFPGRPVISSIVLADVRLDTQPDLSAAVNGSDGAFAFVVPFGDGYWRVGGWNRGRADIPDSAPTSLDELRDITRRALGSDFGMRDERWISRFHSDERQVRAYRTGRVFLAGDAAHTHTPAGGQGMNTGLQDAANLGWKLAAVLKKRAPEALLDTYQTERHPVGKTVVRSSGLILRLAMAHTPAQRTLRTVITGLLNRVRPLRARAIGQVTGIGYAYAAPRGSHRLVGRRAPDIALATGAHGNRLYEALRPGKFVLITPTDLTLPTEEADGRHVISTHWAGPRTTALLVRPDGHVAWADDHPTVTGLRKALSEWTRA